MPSPGLRGRPSRKREGELGLTGTGPLSQLVLASVFVLVNRHWPAGKLVVGFAIGRVDQKAKAVQVVRLCFRVDCDQAETAGLLMSQLVAVLLCYNFRISNCVDVDLVAESVEELAGVVVSVLRAILVRHAHFVRSPPARVTGSNRRRAEAKTV